MSDESPIHQTPYLSDILHPAKGKPWGCYGCRLFQYAPHFSKQHRESYCATLDPDRREKKNTSYKMPHDGPELADVMAVLDYPTRDEDEKGQSFSSGQARSIRKYATNAGMDPASWRWSYLLRCHPPTDVNYNTKLTAYCSKFLAREVERNKPKVIIAFGQTVLEALLGKTGLNIAHFATVPQNAVVAGHRCVVYPMMAPWYILRNDYLVKRYMGHFDRLADFVAGRSAVAEDDSIYKIVETPDEAIDVCRRMIAAVEEGKVIDCDTETSGLNAFKKGQRLSVFSLSCSVKKGYALMLNHNDCPWTPEERARVIKEGLKPLLRHPKVKLRFHNAKFDAVWIKEHLGFWPRDITEDSMLTHYAVDENLEHGLKGLALMYTDMGDYDEELDRVLAAQTYPDAPRFDLVHKDIIGKYAAQDPVATRKLARSLAKDVERQDEAVHALAYRSLPAFSASLTRMEYNGVAVDLDFANNKAMPYLRTESQKSWEAIISQPKVREFIRDREQAERNKRKHPERLPPPDVKQYFTFSLDSPNQLVSLLYEHTETELKEAAKKGVEPRKTYFGHPVTKLSDSGNPSTDKDAMADLIKIGSPIAKAIVEHRLDQKLIGTYLEPIISRCAEQGDNLLHGSFLIHGTKTGRLSSRNPNLQNIPNKGAGLIKRMYVSRYGEDGVFVQADYSQIELRVLAAVSGDTKMIEAYNTGKDLHMLTACMIFGMTEEDYHALPKDEQKRRRTIAKRINFGIAYGIGAPGIQSSLHKEGVDIEEDVAKGYLDSFYENYPRVTKWIERVERGTAADEFSRSLFGRRRRLIEITSEQSDIVAQAERQAVNHVIQSTAADFTMTALCLMDQEICLRAGMNADMILPTIDRREFPVDAAWKQVHIVAQVHDMIGIDCPISMAPQVVDLINRTMPNVVDLAPLVWGAQVKKRLAPMKKVCPEAETEVGPNWRDAYKVKTGADVALAMHIANIKKQKYDADMKYKWTENDEKEAKATFKEAA